MTAEKIAFSVKKRSLIGKKVKQLRNQGMIVGNLVVPNGTSIPLVTDALEFNRLYDKAGESTLIYLSIEGEKTDVPVLVEEVGFNPTNGENIHFVFRKVNLKEKVGAEIPVEVVGEFKLAGAMLLTVRDHVEVRALPTDLPEHFIIDATQLTEVGETVSLADLDYDKTKVELVLPEDADPADMPVVLVQEERAEEPEEAEEVAAEGEESTPEVADGEKATENGESKDKKE